MGKIKIGLYETSNYGKMLAEFLSKKTDLTENWQFTSWEATKKYVEKNRLDVLFVSGEEEAKWADQNGHVGKVIWLSEGDCLRENQEIPVVFKYQSAEAIYKEMLSLVADDETMPGLQWNKPAGNMDFVALGSFYCRDILNNLAFLELEKAIDLSRVLWIDLEPLNTFEYLNESEKSGGLSNLIFYLKQKKENLPLKIQSVMTKKEGMCFIPTVQDYRDLYSLSKRDIEILLKALSQDENRTTVIFNVGVLTEATVYLMSLCNKVYLGSQNSPEDKQREKSFEKILQRENLMEMDNRITYIPVRQGGSWITEKKI